MGFFSKNVFIDIIEWIPQDDSIVVHKHNRHDNEIKNGAQLIVRESQVAVIVEQGQFADVFEPGRHELTTENLPILSDLRGWKHGFDSPFTTEVYFIDASFIANLAWGTPGSISMNDAQFGMVSFTAFGEYDVQVTDPKRFLSRVSKLDQEYTKDELDEFILPDAVAVAQNVITGSGIPILEIQSRTLELAKKCDEMLTEKFEEDYGFKIKGFVIKNISLPDAVKEAIDKRASMGAVGSQSYNDYQMGTAIGDSASNPGSAMGEGMGMGMGMGMAMNMANQMSGQNQQQGGQTPPPSGPQGSAPPPPPGAAPEVAVHVMIGGQQYGPYNLGQVKQYLDEGRIQADGMAWMEGMASWAALNTIPQLSSLFGSAGGPPPPPPPM